MSVYERLAACRDEKYKDFLSRLVPNIPKNTVLGVRTPAMRRIAKEIKGTKEAEEFLSVLPHKYYEENLVHFFLIAMIKDFGECVKAVETFLPYVDCWPVCDQSSPKVFAKEHEKLVPFIEKWISSDHVYTVRFGIVCILSYFAEKEYFGKVFKAVSEIKTDDL